MMESMKQTRKRYAKEFKEEAVRLSEHSDLPVRQIAANLGLHEKVLHRWRREKQLSQQAQTRFAPGQGHPRDMELIQLKKENQQLKQEREVLKKAMAYLMPKPA